MHGSQRRLSAILVAGSLALAPVARASEAPAGEAEATSADDEGSFRTRAAYVHVAPFGIGTLSAPTLFWGLGGGIMLPRGRRAVLAVGGFAEHVVVLDDDPYIAERLMQFVRFGPDLRIGGGRRVFGYGHLRAGLDLLIWRDRPEPSAMTTLGGGVQSLASRRVLLGAEAGVDIMIWGVNGVGFLPRLRVFVGFKFG
ncbi:MAG: hypothetical protein R3B09_35805 [Nannocystaceae bacterium]